MDKELIKGWIVEYMDIKKTCTRLYRAMCRSFSLGALLFSGVFSYVPENRCRPCC